jgi:transposase
MAQEDTSSGKGRRRGRPPKLNREQIETLVSLVREDPYLSLDDIVWTYRMRTGITLSVPTVRRYLLNAGMQRSRPKKRKASSTESGDTNESATAEVSRRQYRYNESHRDPGDATRYPCGLTDSEWEQVKHIFQPSNRVGRPDKYPRRQMLDACVYVLRSGCSWRMLPKDLPPWQAVYKTFRRWTAKGLFEKMYDELRKLWRSREHRPPDPTQAVLDSQSVKGSPQGGPKGYDAGKKIMGRKRHIATDTLGLIIAVLITPASVQDRDAALPLVESAMNKVPGIQKIYVDGGYAGTCVDEIRRKYSIEAHVVRHPENRNVGVWHEGQLALFDPPASRGFVVLPKRWVIERTNAWNERPRRMNRDHDRLLTVSTAWIWLTESRMLLRRLTSEQLKIAV